MNELIKTVGLAKVRADAGFSRVGRRLKADDPADRALMTLAARAVASGNALAALCRDGQGHEALPQLRAIAHFALTMRWIAAADAAARAKETLAALEKARWDALWPDAERARAEDLGVPAWAVKAAFDSGADFARGNAAGLPWGHVFSDVTPAARKPEDVLAAAAVWLALALEALDRRWPGDFPGAAEMRDAAATSRGQ